VGHGKKIPWWQAAEIIGISERQCGVRESAMRAPGTMNRQFPFIHQNRNQRLLRNLRNDCSCEKQVQFKRPEAKYLAGFTDNTRTVAARLAAEICF
jgi:hypothetical protein